jgi:hypothetical protein
VVVAVGVRTIERVMMLIVAPTTIPMPAMATTVRGIEVRTTEVVVVTMRIATIYAEVPVACIPVERTEEVGGCAEEIPLPAIENVIEIGIATLPICAKHIMPTRHSHQIVEIDLVGSFILGI